MHALLVPFVSCALLLATAAVAQVADPHQLYEDHCSACHAFHAGDFVWQELSLSGDALVGAKSGRPVGAMMTAGHGGLSPDQADTLTTHFRAIRDGGRLFMDKCRICHGTAVDLARSSLIVDGEELKGRYSGRDVAAFLLSHGRLTPEQAEAMLKTLTRVARSKGLVKK